MHNEFVNLRRWVAFASGCDIRHRPASVCDGALQQMPKIVKRRLVAFAILREALAQVVDAGVACARAVFARVGSAREIEVKQQPELEAWPWP